MKIGDIVEWNHANAGKISAELRQKLEARYPGGSFDVHKSENRKEGDLRSILNLM